MYFACLKGNISIVYGAFLNLSEYVSEYKHVYLQHYPPNTFLTHWSVILLSEIQLLSFY
jgi:hypothetical protein